MVYLEARPKNMEGKGEVSIRDLLRNALRMRPDRLIIGECRGRETFDLISAMNTGHEGAYLLCIQFVQGLLRKDARHGLTAEEEVPVDVLQSWIAIGVDLIVHTAKRSGGKRIISEISVVGHEPVQGLSSFPVYFYDEGLFLDFPDWYVEKIGPQRTSQLIQSCECGG